MSVGVGDDEAIGGAGDGDLAGMVQPVMPRVDRPVPIGRSWRSNQTSQVASQSRYWRSWSVRIGLRCRAAGRSTSTCTMTVVCWPCGRAAASVSQPASTRLMNASVRVGNPSALSAAR
ncbi:hypothetical protein AWB94_00660 [Mycolicibacterium canariasense]|nr:hypothetical protein AWB94_00660 [Mycolicibacterium canariasense]